MKIKKKIKELTNREVRLICHHHLMTHEECTKDCPFYRFRIDEKGREIALICMPVIKELGHEIPEEWKEKEIEYNDEWN